ncbi:uncharacterized protein LOC144865106 [Branchiostoma floridae x Branchiostoma japonicum]
MAAYQPEKVTFGGVGSGEGQFLGPFGVTVSDEGEIFVADRGNLRIQVFTLQGKFVRQFPTVVSGEEKLKPHDVAMDGEGNLWVVGGTKSAEFAVQYNKQGRVLGKFDLQKTFIIWSRGVTVDTKRNHILITQTMEDRNNRSSHGEVLVFMPDGTLVRTVGQGEKMKHLQYTTVDGEGNILVSDCENDCVYVYNEGGQFLFKFGGKGSGDGQLSHPRGICTDRAGNIIVADWGNRRVEMFDKTGRFLKHITKNIRWPHGVAMATHGQLVVADVTNQTVSIFHNSCCEVLQQQTTLSGEFLPSAPIPAASAPIPEAPAPIQAAPAPIPEAPAPVQMAPASIPAAPEVIFPLGVAVSDEGEIFVADCQNKRILVLTLQGTFVRQFPTVVAGGLKIDPHGVAIDGGGNLWVVGHPWVVGRADLCGFAVQYNKQGKVLRKFDIQKTLGFKGLAVDTRRNHILITESIGLFNQLGVVLVFRPDGTLVRIVGQQKGMWNPQYITVDGEGNILVSDCENHCIYVYNEDGEFLFKFGSYGSGEGQLDRPHGICTDRAGNIIVADGGNHRVAMFDKTGKFLKHITAGMNNKPWAVAMATRWKLVVTHVGNKFLSHCILASGNFAAGGLGHCHNNQRQGGLWFHDQGSHLVHGELEEESSCIQAMLQCQMKGRSL